MVMDWIKKLVSSIQGKVETLGIRPYSIDASILTQTPLCVVHPMDASDVQAVVQIAKNANIPISARGAGTGEDA